MNRICEHCYWDITSKYLIRQKSYDKIICPNCGRPLKVTRISKLLVRYVEVLGIMIILMLPINIKLKLLISGIFTFLGGLYLPTLIYNYEKIEK